MIRTESFSKPIHENQENDCFRPTGLLITFCVKKFQVWSLDRANLVLSCKRVIVVDVGVLLPSCDFVFARLEQRSTTKCSMHVEPHECVFLTGQCWRHDCQCHRRLFSKPTEYLFEGYLLDHARARPRRRIHQGGCASLRQCGQCLRGFDHRYCRTSGHFLRHYREGCHRLSKWRAEFPTMSGRYSDLWVR